MIVRLKITLTQQEYSALLKLARAKLRNPSDQAHHIIRKELHQLCYLKYERKESDTHENN